MSKKFLCLLPLLLASLSCGDDKPDVYAISVPALKISPDESVVSMDLRINAGSVQSVEGIPIGWNITVDDDSSWRTHIKGNSTLPAASLSADELRRLTFIVRRNENDTFKFDITGGFTLSKNFEQPRMMSVTMEDFSLKASQ